MPEPATARKGTNVNQWFDAELIEAIDKWKHRNQLDTRKEAMEWLWRFALAQKPKVEQ